MKLNGVNTSEHDTISLCIEAMESQLDTIPDDGSVEGYRTAHMAISKIRRLVDECIDDPACSATTCLYNAGLIADHCQDITKVLGGCGNPVVQSVGCLIVTNGATIIMMLKRIGRQKRDRIMAGIQS